LKRAQALALSILLLAAVLAVYRLTPAAMATTFLSENFESFPTGWTAVGAEKAGAVAHGGTYSALVNSNTTQSQAYAYKSFTQLPAANHHYGVWIWINASATWTNGITVSEPYDGGSKVSIYSSVSYIASAFTWQNAGSAGNMTTISTLTAGTWHHIEGYYTYSSGVIHYFLDGGIISGDFIGYGGATARPNVVYFGDLSTTPPFVGNGWVYYDDMILDDAAEPTIPMVLTAPATNSTLIYDTWALSCRWWIAVGTLSGFISCLNESGTPTNATWQVFTTENESWSNVTIFISNMIGSVIQWILYVNCSSGAWASTSAAWTVAANITFYWDGSGSLRLNATNIGNATVLSYSATAGLNLGALPAANMSFLNFTWSYGSSTTNSFNFTVVNNTVFWVYFGNVTAGGGISRTMPEDLASWVVGGFIGVLVLIAAVLIWGRRH